MDLRQEAHFEGQAAMELEFALESFTADESYPFRTGAASSLLTDKHLQASSHGSRRPIVLDWAPMVSAILADLGRAPAGLIALKFHNTLVEAIIAVARQAGEERVALSGGCFQNRYLTERAVQRLRGEGFRPYWHQRIPPNDGGIALGQVVAARRGVGQPITAAESESAVSRGG